MGKLLYFCDFMLNNGITTFGSRIVTIAIIASCAFLATGCGTTRWSDTSRTGTEQLLISNAIDNAVSRIDFSPLGDKRVYLKTDAIEGVTDHKYLAMTLRQHLAASGGILCDIIDDADYVVEARAGAIGTDRDELLLLGVPAITLPSITGTDISNVSIPEIPIIKRTKQRGVAKVAVFGYNKHTGRPIWASGNNQYESLTNNLWIAGSGPLTRGTIYEESTYAGHPIPRWMQRKNDRRPNSFADFAAVFPESPNDKPLKSEEKSDSAKSPEPTLSPGPILAPPGLPGPLNPPSPPRRHRPGPTLHQVPITPPSSSTVPSYPGASITKTEENEQKSVFSFPWPLTK